MPKLVLIGEGQASQHGGLEHVADELDCTNIPAGQRTVSVLADAGDSRPSGNVTRTLHTEKGGPSSPIVNGSQRSLIREAAIDSNFASFVTDDMPRVAGTSTHDALVTLETVNNGM